MTPTEALRAWLRERMKPIPIDISHMRSAGPDEPYGWVQWDCNGWMPSDCWQAMMKVFGIGHFSLISYQGVGDKATGKFFISPEAVARLNKFVAHS